MINNTYLLSLVLKFSGSKMLLTLIMQKLAYKFLNSGGINKIGKTLSRKLVSKSPCVSDVSAWLKSNLQMPRASMDLCQSVGDGPGNLPCRQGDITEGV